MQTFPKDFDHYVEYTKKRMWKNNFNLILFGRKFLQRGIVKCWNTEIDWIMKKNKHVIIVSFDARNPFPERWDCCVMVKPNQKQTKKICKQKHRV